MAAITLETAQAQLDAYIAAETKVLLGQAATVDGRTLTLADLNAIQRGIALWASRVDVATHAASGRGRCRTVAPGW